MYERKATRSEIRKYFKDKGHTVHITSEGNINFKRNGEGPWLFGGYAKDYFICDETGLQY